MIQGCNPKNGMDILMKTRIVLWGGGIVVLYAIGYQVKYTTIREVFGLFGIAELVIQKIISLKICGKNFGYGLINCNNTL